MLPSAIICRWAFGSKVNLVTLTPPETAPQSIRQTQPNPQITAPNSRRLPVVAINGFTATVNMFYDIPVNFAGIAPYVGAGVGYYHVSSDTVIFSAPFRLTGSGSDGSNAVVLAEAGVTIPLAPNLKLVPAYRYAHFFDNPNGENSHQIKVGLRYDF